MTVSLRRIYTSAEHLEDSSSMQIGDQVGIKPLTLHVGP